MAYVKWLIVLLCLSVSACAPGEAAVSPTAQTAVPAVVPTAALPTVTPIATTTNGQATQSGAMPTDPEKAKAQLQPVLDQYLDIMNRGDADALAKVVDQTNLTFRRVQSEFMKSPVYSWKGRNPKGTVQKVQFVKEPYVKVWLNESIRGDHIWVYKWTEQGWLLSEPTEDELGPLKNRETERYTVRYYEWDESLVDDMLKSIDQAQVAAEQATGRKPQDKFLVRLAPTFETHAGRAGIGVAANYVPDSNFLAIRSPESFGGTFAGIGAAKSIPDIQHELTHLLVREVTYPSSPLSWLNEAMAYYFTNDLRASTVHAALAHKVYSLKELNQLTITTDEQENRFIQAEATIVVQYIVEKLGGREKAWEWLIQETKIRSFDESLQKVFGLTTDQFEKGWQDFMKQKYG